MTTDTPTRALIDGATQTVPMSAMWWTPRPENEEESDE